MRKVTLYLSLLCLAVSTFFLPSCSSIDSEKVSPFTLEKVESILKDEDFIQLMKVRTGINALLEIKSVQEHSLPLSQITSLKQSESKVTAMGFHSLEEYRTLMSIEIFYLERLKEKIPNLKKFNEANRMYLVKQKEIELKKIKSSKTCLECQLAYINTTYVLRENRDQAINNCNYTRNLSLNACPQSYFPDRRLCINISFSYQWCFNVPAGYYYINDCPNNVSATYDNCIYNANTTYDTAFNSAGINLAICNIGCTN